MLQKKNLKNTRVKLYQTKGGLLVACLLVAGFIMCGRLTTHDNETMDELMELGLSPDIISAEDFFRGITPPDFQNRTGAPYKPGFNEEPSIPPQCWIETGYGTQNACKYCHTDYLSSIRHGNAFPIAYQQILYSFPSPELNRILWQNIIYPENIEQRLKAEGIPLPAFDDVDYVRQDNWRPAFLKARSNGNDAWVNYDDIESDWAFFPALNPDHLFPYKPENPTSGGVHGYIDQEGFVRNELEQYTGWRAINFFPYSIFTPLTGSVSGIYIRLPEEFYSVDGQVDISTYKDNLRLLERNIKNQLPEETFYLGDASSIPVNRGFYPVGTEFAHPLHYVDLQADGESGNILSAVSGDDRYDYAFPGTRSKRVKEIRYMYKWKDVELEDIGLDEHEEEGFGEFIGKEGQGWVDNGGGWILAAYIENRSGDLRPQTTEELAQCIGCHANVGNTVDAVWSFQRKLPGTLGWQEMDYGAYDANRPELSQLHDYMHESSGMGELGYFYYTVVGADLYGVMTEEVKAEILDYCYANNIGNTLNLMLPIELLFDDEQLKNLGQNERKEILVERQKVMRQYANDAAYLYRDSSGAFYVKGELLYPSAQTMKNNIQLYRKIVLDQSYNLGKDVFGTEAAHIPFTFRSDGMVLDAQFEKIPAGEVITSRPYNEDGEGITPTGLVAVDEEGNPADENGNAVGNEFYRAIGHISNGGTFDMMYNPILSDQVFKPAR